MSETSLKNYVHQDVTKEIIGAAIEVHNTLGSGFLENVYENALAEELRVRKVVVSQQVPAKVHYKSKLVGEYVMDLLVQEKVVVELKTVDSLSDVHKAQLLNYMRATGLRVGILFHFNAPKLEWKRLIL